MRETSASSEKLDIHVKRLSPTCLRFTPATLPKLSSALAARSPSRLRQQAPSLPNGDLRVRCQNLDIQRIRGKKRLDLIPTTIGNSKLSTTKCFDVFDGAPVIWHLLTSPLSRRDSRGARGASVTDVSPLFQASSACADLAPLHPSSGSAAIFTKGDRNCALLLKPRTCPNHLSFGRRRGWAFTYDMRLKLADSAFASAKRIVMLMPERKSNRSRAPIRATNHTRRFSARPPATLLFFATGGSLTALRP